MVAEAQQELQARQPADYYAVLIRSFLIACASSLILQETLKVFLITLVSEQYWPNVAVLRRSPQREAIRLCVRALLGVAYVFLCAL